jgi:hypothetical protein
MLFNVSLQKANITLAWHTSFSTMTRLINVEHSSEHKPCLSEHDETTEMKYKSGMCFRNHFKVSSSK